MSAVPSTEDRRVRRFEWCVRGSLYVVMALELLIVLGTVTQTSVGVVGTRMITSATLLHVAANIVLVSWALTSRKQSLRLSSLWSRLGLAWGTAALVIGLLGWHLGAGALGMTLYVLVLTWSALAPWLSFRAMIAGAAAVALGCGGVSAVLMDGSASLVAGSVTGMVVVALALPTSVWLSGWMLRVYWELDVARRDSARLAIAEERLRISRDLHDVFGRTLATVAVKSELAAELVRRGRNEEAAAEIGQVRVIADEAGREVRQVVRGYREADLPVELEGARSLLAAAGIGCLIDGAVDQLTPSATSTLAWVTREAVTNLIKHSRATAVEIALRPGDPLVLTIENDGVTEAAGTDTGGGGQGLVGMAERVREAGGEFRAEAVDDHFRVWVSVPNGAGAESVDLSPAAAGIDA